MQKKELEQILLILKKLKNYLHSFVHYVITIIYPDVCLSCGKILDSEGFCVNCWKELVFIKKPYCFLCGRPLDINSQMGLICADCINKKYYFDRVFSVFVYNRVIAKAIFRFKFNRKTFLSKFFAKFLNNKLKECNEKIDFIVPIPMNVMKLRNRGYNQAVLLAKDLSKMVKIPCIYDLIIKTKNTKAQSSLSHKERKFNLKLAFKLNEKYKDIVKNKNILIVDDVFTTGSTANECSKILKKSGAVGRIFVLTIAKTVHRQK
ncbi:MAG: ComF family protein [Rickettsiales bacterium]|nr:ComF family protein [Rickettsiales bacterium]